MKRALLLAVVCGLSSGAHAAIVQYHANLDGLQVVAPNASPGIGMGQFLFDTNSNQLSLTSGWYQGLLGGALDVGIHAAPPGLNGGTIFMLTLDTPGATTGTFSGSGALTLAQATSLNDGHLYLLLRSQVFTGGEIRGQLFQVPAPGAAALLGLAGLSAMRRRRQP